MLCHLSVWWWHLNKTALNWLYYYTRAFIAFPSSQLTATLSAVFVSHRHEGCLLDAHLLYKGKVKVAHTRLPSIGFRRTWFLAVSLQVMWVINPAIGCHYFPPGLQLCSWPIGQYFRCLVNSLPKTVTRQHRGCDLNPCPSAPEYSTLTTRLLSHPIYYILWHYLDHLTSILVRGESSGSLVNSFIV